MLELEFTRRKTQRYVRLSAKLTWQGRLALWLFSLVALFANALPATAQTACGEKHLGPAGVFICYPTSTLPGSQGVPQVFHLSAQGNARPGMVIRRYVVSLDNQPIYEKRLNQSLKSISIENNIRAPFSSGVHKVSLYVDGAGSAEVSNVQFHLVPSLGFCDPFSRVTATSCINSRLRNTLEWAQRTASDSSPSRDPGAFYPSYDNLAQLYSENLKSIEGDVADAVTLDDKGALYAAFHRGPSLEFRKYGSDGSLLYENIIQACGPGFQSIAGIALNKNGKVWIAGTTTACLRPTENAAEKSIDVPAAPHGFLALVDPTRAGSAGLVTLTYVSRYSNRISGLALSDDGSPYVAGSSFSPDLAHQSVLSVNGASQEFVKEDTGFLMSWNDSGSQLRWTAILPGTNPAAIDIGTSGVVNLLLNMKSPKTGHLDLSLVGIADEGARLSFQTRISGTPAIMGTALSSTRGGWLLVAGRRFLEPGSKALREKASGGAAPFVFAMKPCVSGYAHRLEDPIPKPYADVVERLALKTFSAVAPRLLAQPSALGWKVSDQDSASRGCNSEGN
jgi:hypothetical protein